MEKFLIRKPGPASATGNAAASSSRPANKNTAMDVDTEFLAPSTSKPVKGSGDGKTRTREAGTFFSSRSTALPVEKKSLPWVDKYRPKSIDDIAFQTDVVAVLRKSLSGEDFPHMLFYGPPGTGKTSSILAVCRELFGAELMKERVLELNASDERGISVVREKIKTFAQYFTTSIRADGKSCPPFKIIILDEADSMTNAAQAALRRIMEKESKGTRFCLICNYISRIIEPLASRCARFRFKPLPVGIIKDRLSLISSQEDIKLEDKALTALIVASDGDLRRAITLLQSISKLLKGTVVKKSDVLELTGYIPDDQVTTFLEKCRTSNYDKLQNYVNDMVLSGFGAGQLFSQLYDNLLENSQLKDHQKALIMEELAIADHRLMDGADEFLQMMSVAGEVVKAWKTAA